MGFVHQPHPHLARRAEGSPPHSARQQQRGINGWLALKVTGIVSTMFCAYAFTLLALVALPSALHAGTYFIIVWLSSTLLQLVFLPILAVGQSILGKAGDARAEATWHDASATLHECLEVQRHLEQQDVLLAALLAQQERADAHPPPVSE